MSASRPPITPTAPSTAEVCPACERGRLVPRQISQVYRASEGRTFSVAGIEVDHCLDCGNDSMNPQQIRANEARVRRRKEALGLA